MAIIPLANLFYISRFLIGCQPNSSLFLLRWRTSLLIVGPLRRPGTCHWGLTFQESTKVDKSNQGEEWDGHTELWLSHLPTTMIASWCVGKSTENCFSLYWVVDWKAAAVTLCRRLGVSSERKIFSAQSSCRLGTGLSKHGKGTKVKGGTHFEITWVVSSSVDLQEKGRRHFLLYSV